MKLYIDYKINDSGKGKFLQRLIPYLEELGIKCSFKKKKADIALGIRRWRNELKIPKILRVDGLHMYREKKTYYTNQLTKKSIKISDGIIWQSQFCKDMVTGIFKIKPKKEFVIFNGANPDHYSKGQVYNKQHRYRVLMSARWKERPWKRLKDCIDVAKEVMLLVPDVEFCILGKVDKKNNIKNMKYYGHLSENVMRKIIPECDAMLNLSYYDWCPNAVVEALVAGVPVVCNNASGVKEIIDPESCEIVNCDLEPIPKVWNHDKPPRVNPKPVAEALIRILNSGKRASCPWLNIKSIAEQYKKAFESILK